MKDANIREIMKRTELSQYINDPFSKVVPELKLPVVKARIDIAVINGHLHGYEIKSASDTLQRLPSQLTAYSKVFDYITIVTELKYHERILNIVPEWVGVCVCSDNKNEKEFEVKKVATINSNKEGFFISKLLWHDELVEALTEQKIPVNKYARNWILCEIMARHIPINKLSEIVRDKLKKRENWKSREDYE